MSSIYHQISLIEQSNVKAVLCTIIFSKGSAPRKAGTKMIVYETGEIFGTIGGGALEEETIKQALQALKLNHPQTTKYNLVSDLSMCCGGTVELFLEPIMNRSKLYIFGAGHVGKALAKFSVTLDFDITIIDDRNEHIKDLISEGFKCVNENHITAIEQLSFDKNTFIVILTYDHQHDREILALTSNKQTAYIGMIGSERKVAIAKKNLIGLSGLNECSLNKIDMPIGISIGAITPEEIAVSILAKLIEVRSAIRKIM